VNVLGGGLMPDVINPGEMTLNVLNIPEVSPLKKPVYVFVKTISVELGGNGMTKTMLQIFF
jgi:hypothetical protein